MARRGLHWFWRGAIATLISCLLLGVSWGVILSVYERVHPWLHDVIGQKIDGNKIAVPLLIGLPTLIVAFTVYALLTRFAGPKGEAEAETRCRKCGYILRGLREPVCSECGERI